MAVKYHFVFTKWADVQIDRISEGRVTIIELTASARGTSETSNDK